MAHVFASAVRALEYAADNSFKRPLRWLLITVLYLAAALAMGFALSYLQMMAGSTPPVALGILAGILGLVLSFFFAGIVLQIFARQEISLKHFLRTAGRGALSVLIYLIWGIIPVGLSAVVLMMTAAPAETAAAGIAGAGLFLIVPAVLLILYGMFVIPAQMQFARTGRFSAAFSFGVICQQIRQAGWLKVLAGLIVWLAAGIVLSLAVLLVSSLVIIVPVIGPALGVAVASFLSFFILLFAADYWAEFFAD